MKFSLVAILLIFASIIEPGMKFKEAFTIDAKLQPGIPVFNTEKGWLVATVGKSNFTNQLCSIDYDGKILWQKGFAFATSSLAMENEGLMLLDDRGNFYQLDQTGKMVANLADVVPPGKNVMAKGAEDLVYASGGDESVTCFRTDGNVEWVAMGKSQPVSLVSIEDGVIACEHDGAFVRYTNEGEESWRLKVDGFAPNSPLKLENGNMVWGLRTADGSRGWAMEISPEGKKIWSTQLNKGADWVFPFKGGYMVIGPLYSASLDKNGKFVWDQPFDGSRKLYPLGFNDDGRLVLGIHTMEGNEELLKITLLHGGGKISIVGKIPLAKNSLVNVARQGNLFMVGLKDKTVVYKAITMKEFIERE